MLPDILLNTTNPMNNLTAIFLLTLLIACQNQLNETSSNRPTEKIEPIEEKSFISLGGEEQYVEITGASDQLPILLFLHGGPGWPQTPHIRYFNSDLSKEMIVVSWDQAGCGQSYMRNPNPKNLSVESLVDDAHELTGYLKKKFNREKIFLLGFSYGSVIGLQLAELYPEDYHAYIGVSQLINSQDNWDASMKWLWEQAELKNDTAVLNQLTLLEHRDTSVCKTNLDCFMSKYFLLVDYNGTIYNPETAKEIEKAEHYYEEYKDYDWFAVYNYTCSRLGDKRLETDLTHITSLEIPIIFMAGSHDWNLPGIVAEAHLDKMTAPVKRYVWFDKSGHEPPEEEPEKFNAAIIDIVKEFEGKSQ